MTLTVSKRERESQMSVERYCTKAGCPGGGGCINTWRKPDDQCTYEYVASKDRPQYNWKGEGNPPARWVALDGTHVYRSMADYYDD